MRKCQVGGQAVLEGVMMRGSKGTATAVRTPEGDIEVSFEKTIPYTKKINFRATFYKGIYNSYRVFNCRIKITKLFSKFF